MGRLLRENIVIPVKVEQLFLSNKGFVVLLKGDSDPRSLPIFIDGDQARSIAICLNGLEVPRPLTHDLLKNLLDFLECRLLRVEICDRKEGVFYSRLVLVREMEETALDSRPSDAIALALRAHAPLFVAEAVMDEAGQVVETQATGEVKTPEAGDPAKSPIHQKLTPVETLGKELDKAVVEERFEDAARLRDEINRLKAKHDTN
jgi:bifunctional DNase/RNase